VIRFSAIVVAVALIGYPPFGALVSGGVALPFHGLRPS
jgi:hypothetical protein